MKQLKLTFLISVLAIFMGQTINAQWLSFSKNKAVKYQNAVRSYYELNLLSLDRELSRSAQLWAEEMAETDDFLFSPYEFGETIYRLNKKEFFEPKNSYLDAAVAWIQAYEEPEYYQTLCVDCAFVGYGKAENESYIYIVAKYDKLYK